MYSAYLSGAREVMRHKDTLNKINFFPVADGDTGTNLCSTMNSIIRESSPHDSISKTLLSIADSALKGARGNSGIIFAQYLYGLGNESVNARSMTIDDFVDTNLKAVTYAYEAIAEPVEGTIITVIKDFAEALHRIRQHSIDFIELVNSAYLELEKSVKNTTNQIKILKQSGVVDSGAKGFSLFIKGFLDHLRSGKEDLSIDNCRVQEEDIVLEVPTHSHLEILHRYCTEAMIEGNGIENHSLQEMLAGLGDSLLVAGNSRRAKIHIHADEPYRVFDILRDVGKITYQKVDDMAKQNDVIENKRYQIALVTDSIADLPKDFVDRHQIHVIPLNILLGDISYLDKLTILNKTVLEYADGDNGLPTSAQPDYKVIENLFSFLSTYYKSILVITVAKPLSGTFSLISKVASEFKSRFPEIYVVDSKLNSAAQGLLVKRAQRYLEQGLGIQEILDKVRQDIPNGRILVNVKTIDNMIKSGRLGVRAGKIARMLHLKPIVSLDETGKGNLSGIAFSFGGSLRKAIAVVKKTMKKKTIENYALVHADNYEEACRYARVFTDIIGFPPDFIEEVSSITAVAAGRGTVAVSFITN
jgi:uncharacterized protein